MYFVIIMNIETGTFLFILSIKNNYITGKIQVNQKCLDLLVKVNLYKLLSTNCKSITNANSIKCQNNIFFIYITNVSSVPCECTDYED